MYSQSNQFRLVKRRSKMSLWLIAATVVLVSLAGFAYWYALSPVNRNSHEAVQIVVRPGSTVAGIAHTLRSHELIRNEWAFRLFVQLSGQKGELQAGGYAFSQSQSLSEIVQRLRGGKLDDIVITILPGQREDQLKAKFVKDGFSQTEVDAAFSKNYTHPLLKDKPSSASLEGYVYPETYHIAPNGSLESLLVKSFDEFYKRIQDANVEQRLKERGYSLYQGITLASIVQQEVSDAQEQRQVAQVFLKRLAINMPLGSDATFVYAARKDGAAPSVEYESPYNTRKYGGLPPGPISNFNFSALEATVNPLPGEYLYFVSGDDGVTHFSLTEEEHRANTAKYCTKLCNNIGEFID